MFVRCNSALTFYREIAPRATLRANGLATDVKNLVTSRGKLNLMILPVVVILVHLR
jgi:hypothetical protein